MLTNELTSKDQNDVSKEGSQFGGNLEIRDETRKDLRKSSSVHDYRGPQNWNRQGKNHKTT